MSQPLGASVAEFGPNLAFPPRLLQGWDGGPTLRQMLQINSVRFALQFTVHRALTTLTTSGLLQLCELSYDDSFNLLATPFASGGRSPLADMPPLAIGFQEIPIPDQRPFFPDNVAYVIALHTNVVSLDGGDPADYDGRLFLYPDAANLAGLGGSLVVDGSFGTLAGVPTFVGFNKDGFYVDGRFATSCPGGSYQWLDNAVIMPAFP